MTINSGARGAKKSDAHEIDAQGLLLSAARLIERALIKLNTTTVECPCCMRALWEVIDHGRVYEQFSDLPSKLRQAVHRLDETSRASSRGYAEAVKARRARVE